MNKRSTIPVILAIILIVIINWSCSRDTSINALVLTGQNNHNWQRSSVALQQILERAGIFNVDRIQSPPEGEDMSGFIIDFSPYDVVILDYTGDNWPEETQRNFVSYVQNGGGVVVFHASNNAFPGWPEYNEIIGLGGWGGRDENSGPYVYIDKGEVVRDNAPGRGGSHGSRHEFVVHAFNPSHPVLNGLPEKWLHAEDELYSELRGPAANMEILAYAHADEKFGGTGRNEPILMTISYGRGRIFHTVLGHAGRDDRFFPAMESAGFVVTTQRGAEWAATGKVTLPVPAAFPTETQSLRWEFYEDVYTDIKPVVKRMQEYEIGKSNESFIIFKKLIAENFNNQIKMDEYHNIIRDLLKSRNSTVECKRILLTDFSWIANDSYIDIYNELKNNQSLSDEAQYALDAMGNF
jgi:uncharacterized protein